MTDYKLQYKQKLSRRVAKELVIHFAKNENFDKRNQRSFRSDADVKRYFASRRIDFGRVVEECRDYSKQVPFFENLVGSTWTITGGAKVSVVDMETGDKIKEIQGPGKISTHEYWATFESVVEARDRCVENLSYQDFQTAVVQGVASIEGYLNYLANLWNSRNPENQLIDSRDNKVSFDDKISEWILIMTDGKKLDKSKVNWAHFKVLRSIRDNVSIHPKEPGSGVSYKDLANGLNMIKTGISGLLIQLHMLFNEKIPAVIIRAAYAPDVEVVEQE